MIFQNGLPVFKVVEEEIPTGGNYQCRGECFSVVNSGITNFDVSWPMPVSVYAAEFSALDNNIGDNVEVIIAPKVVIGVLAQPVSIGATSVVVSSTVLTNMKVGYYLTLADGTNTDELGRCVAIDHPTSTLTFEFAITHAFSNATPTYCKRDVKFIPNYALSDVWLYNIGQAKIGGAYLPANTILRFAYNNITGGTKKFPVHLEYTY